MWPPGCLMEAIDVAQSKPAASADVLGDEEWLKYPPHRILKHACSGVCDGNMHVVVGWKIIRISKTGGADMHVLGLNSQPPAALYRISCVTQRLSKADSSGLSFTATFQLSAAGVIAIFTHSPSGRPGMSAMPMIFHRYSRPSGSAATCP